MKRLHTAAAAVPSPDAPAESVLAAAGGVDAPRRTQLRELLPTMLSRRSWDLRRNPYARFGLFWGIPVPVFSLAIDLMARGWPLAPASIAELLRINPLQWFLLLHPLFFMGIFGAMGHIRLQRDAEIRRLITSLRHKVRQLDQANQDLGQLEVLKSEFVSNVTHELKTPLVTVRGYCEMLAKGRLGPVTEPQARALETMSRNVHRLLGMIQNILQFGRLKQQGELSLSRSRFDVLDLVQRLAADFDPILGERRLSLGIDAAGRGLEAVADRDQIAHVISNLLSNACKFTPPEGRITIGIRQLRTGELRIEVSDTGPGIPPEEQALVFERFRQADGSQRRKYGGTGLGLAIVREILQSHGSVIRLESRVGEGSRFWFELPGAHGPGGSGDSTSM